MTWSRAGPGFGFWRRADALWLAQNGWQTTGLDISTVAVQRAQAAAKAQGFSEAQVRFEAADLLSGWRSDLTFDLVTASFLQSPWHSTGSVRFR